MSTRAQTLTKHAKPQAFLWKHRVLLITLLGFVGLVSILATRSYINRPRDLGSSLQYVGKISSGCIIPVCDSPAGATYYFATDMQVANLPKYFKHAACNLPDNIGGSLLCVLPDNTGSFYATYYTNDDKNISGVDADAINFLEQTGKAVILSINGEDYTKAKTAL